MAKIIDFKQAKKNLIAETELFEFPTTVPQYLYVWERHSQPEFDFREGWKLFEDNWKFVENSKINYATLAIGVSVALDVAKDFQAANELQSIMQGMFARNACTTYIKFIPKHLLGFMFYFGTRDNAKGIPEVDNVYFHSRFSAIPQLWFSTPTSSDPKHPLNENPEAFRVPAYARPFLKKT